MNFTRTALRTLCAQAPKLAARNTSVVARQSNLFNNKVAATATNSFRLYSTAGAPESTGIELAKSLEKEIAHEKETFDYEGIQHILKNFPFQMEHKIGDREIKFVRTLGDEKITITMMIDESSHQEEDMDMEEHDHEAEAEAPMLVIPFSVIINKPLKPELGAMVFSMYCDDTGIAPQMTWHSTNAEDVEASLPTCYPGPNLTDLDQVLEASMADYLKARGIDDSITDVIQEVYHDKEQREYVNWLEKLEKFVAN